MSNRLPNLSRTEQLILEMLVVGRQMYGLEMVRQSDGKLKKGSVYVILSRMEDKGFVDSHKETLATDAQNLPRRLYFVTGLGARVLKAWNTAGTMLMEGVT